MNISKAILIALASAMLLTGVSSTAVAASQNWYMGGDQVLVANRNDLPPVDPESEAAVVSVAPGNTLHWDANEAAMVDVEFGTGDFSYSFHVKGVADFGSYCVAFGTWNGAVFNANAESCSTKAASCVGQLCFGTVGVADFMVPMGEYLSMRVTNPGDTTAALKIFHTDEDSFFTSTNVDPGYPTPELGTILLTGAGLGVVAMVVARRRA